MSELPAGTVTLLFTDIEGSSRLLEQLGAEYEQVLAEHRRLIRSAVAAHAGVEVDTQGDAFLCAFASARAAVEAAAESQRALAATPVRVRMGLHTGEPTRNAEGYVGIDLHRGVRVMAAGHGGQVLLTEATRALLDAELPLIDLGEHRLKDLAAPVRLYQLGSEEYPALKTLENRPTNLPIQPTALVGRERELQELQQLLGETRLLTLTGPGGTGKTRLALQLAAEQLDCFEDGVFVVSLALVAGPELVLPTIARTLGLREQAGEPIETTLTRYLQGRELLLVLDNLEQVLGVATQLGGLLSACPRLRQITTSREPLHLAGEQEYPVPPLAEAEAVALFVERARALTPAFVLDGNAATVTEICRRLDSLPLAVELAAARVKLLPPRKLLERLEARLAVLTGGPRDLPERQQTLRAAIDWSHELLTDSEKGLFCRLSVFPGGCTLEAAEDVCEADVDTIASLVDKSLLRQREDPEGDPRFTMLGTIREYAEEKLAVAGALDDMRHRHAEHFLALAESAEPELRAAGQRRWLARLEAEHDNLRAALAWALDRDSAVALRLVGALSWFWELHGYVREGRRWATAAIELGDADRPSVRARAYAAAGSLAWWEAEYSNSVELLEHALRLFREESDIRRVAITLADLAYALQGQGNRDDARAAAEEGLRLSREAGDPWCTAYALAALSPLSVEGDEEAIARVAEATRLYESLGDEYMAARTVTDLGWLSLLRGDYERAESLSLEGASLSEGLGDATHRLISQNNLGLAALLGGHVDRAERLLAGNLDELRSSGLKRSEAEALWALAGVAAARDDVDRAARLLGAAEAAIEEAQSTPSPVELRIKEQVLDRLGSDAFLAAHNEGRTMPLSDAVSYALGN